jgi:hypothetical protein
MCQSVLSLDEPASPLAWSSCADPAQTIRAPSAFTDHEPETGSPRVCDSMPGFDSLEPPGKIEPAPLCDRLDLIDAGTTSPSPSAFHIIDHLVADAP